MTVRGFVKIQFIVTYCIKLKKPKKQMYEYEEACKDYPLLMWGLIITILVEVENWQQGASREMGQNGKLSDTETGPWRDGLMAQWGREEEEQQGWAGRVSHPSLTFRSLVYLQKAGTALPLVMWNQYLIKAELGRLIGTDLPSGGLNHCSDSVNHPSHCGSLLEKLTIFTCKSFASAVQTLINDCSRHLIW